MWASYIASEGDQSVGGVVRGCSSQVVDRADIISACVYVYSCAEGVRPQDSHSQAGRAAWRARFKDTSGDSDGVRVPYMPDGNERENFERDRLRTGAGTVGERRELTQLPNSEERAAEPNKKPEQFNKCVCALSTHWVVLWSCITPK